MKARSRRYLLFIIGSVAVPMSVYTQMTVSDAHPNNPLGVLLGCIGLLVVLIVYASAGVTFCIEWIIRKCRPTSQSRDNNPTQDVINAPTQA